MRSTRHDDRKGTFIHGSYAGDLVMETAMGRHGLRNAENKQAVALPRFPCDGRRERISLQGHVDFPPSLLVRPRRGAAYRRDGCSDGRFRASASQVEHSGRDPPRSGDQAGQTQGELAVWAIIDGKKQALYVGNEALRFERFTLEAGLLLLVQWKPR